MMLAVDPLVAIPAGKVGLEGAISLPDPVQGLVVFAHGGGPGRKSPPSRHMAQALHRAGMGTLLVDLLAPREAADVRACLDVRLLSERLACALHFLRTRRDTRGLPLGIFGAGTGAGAALRVAAEMPALVRAVVARRGRPDLAGLDALQRIQAPTLLIVGPEDREAMEANRRASEAMLHCTRRLAVAPPDRVERLAVEWFARHLG